MYVRSIAIGRFRHLNNVKLGPFLEPPSSGELVTLAGPNGGGKSSELELLAYALSSSWSLSWQLGRTFPESSFEVELRISGDERKLVGEWLASNPGYAQVDEIEAFLKQSGSI